jgi:hypothetical protein
VAAIPEEEEGKCNQHRRVELRTSISSGKRSSGLQDLKKTLELEFMK